MSDLIEDLIRARIGRGDSIREDFKGCTDAEISGLETRMGIELPALFKAYLRKMGRTAGELIPGTDLRFGCLHELTGEAREAAGEENVDLPDDIFAFFAHQGYDYMYFLLSEGSDDPKIYRFHQDWQAPRQVFPALSDYLTWLFETADEIPPDGLPDESR